MLYKFVTYAQQVNEKYVDEYLTEFHITQSDLCEYCYENNLNEKWLMENYTWDLTEQIYLWAENKNVIVADELVARNIHLVDKVVHQFTQVAINYELNGTEVSVCDNCERTYPSEWVINNVCPFCLKEHTEGLEELSNEKV